MPETSPTLPQLRGLIGQCVSFHGVTCHIIEVLDDGPTMVLQDDERNADIQDNQYGEPSRRVPRVYQVPVWDRERSALHAEFDGLTLLSCQ